MKRRIAAIILSVLFVAAPGLADTTTPNISLTIPGRGSQGWADKLNTNFGTIDTHVGGLNNAIDDLPEVERHTGTFNSTTGDVISLSKTVDAVNEYGVEIVPTSRAAAIGDIWVTKGTSSFTVHCAESNTSDTFEAIVFHTGDMTSYGGSMYRRYYVSPSTSITDHSVASTVGSLAYILNAMSGTSGIVELPGNRTYTLTANDVTIPAGIRLLFQPGAVISIAGGKTLAFGAPENISAQANQQVFSGSGAVTFSDRGTVYPQWWGGPSIDIGAVDATSAIRNAIASLTVGGTVFLKAGTYKCYPQSVGTADHVFTISVDHMHIVGAGKNQTKLDFYALNGDNPETDYEVLNKSVVSGYISGYDPWGSATTLVWRGNGFYIQGGASTGAKRKDILFSGFEMDGNCAYTGDYVWPADTADGDGWDITHRAIALNVASADVKWFDNIRCEDLHIHNWKGELIYGATENDGSLSRYFVERCTLHDTNAEAFSISGQNVYRWNEMYNMYIGTEDSYRGSPNTYAFNHYHDIEYQGASFSNGGEGEPYGPIIFENNTLMDIPGFGVHANDVKNVFIRNNLIIDCGQLSGYRGIDVNESGERVENLNIIGNDIIYHTANGHMGICVYVGTTYEATGVIVKNNNVKLTKNAYDSGKTLYKAFYFLGDFGDDCYLKENSVFEYGAGGSLEVLEELITSTGATLVLSTIPLSPGFHVVDLYYRIVTAATDVILTISYYDMAGTAISEEVVKVTAQAVGSYHVASTTITSNETNLIQVHATVSAANQVYVSTKIREL